MGYGKNEVDKSKVDVSMKTVMGAYADTKVTTKNQGGGKIMTLGNYSDSEKSDKAKKIDWSFGHKYQGQNRGNE